MTSTTLPKSTPASELSTSELPTSELPTSDTNLRNNLEHYVPCAAAFSAQGSRSHQEDGYVIWQGHHPQAGPLSIFAVFDGHSGTVSMTQCRNHLVYEITSHPGWRTEDPGIRSILYDAIIALEKRCLIETRHTESFDGTTVCVALMYCNSVYIANVGDSRALLVKNSGPALRLTDDHKVSTPSEQRRLVRCGASIKGCRLLGIRRNLAVSRSLGDRDFKDFDQFVRPQVSPGLIATPDISRFDLVEWTNHDHQQLDHSQSGLTGQTSHDGHQAIHKQSSPVTSIDNLANSNNADTNESPADKNAGSNSTSEGSGSVHLDGALLLLATDGLWDIDFFEDGPISKFVVQQFKRRNSLLQAATDVVEEAQRCRNGDNCTLILVRICCPRHLRQCNLPEAQSDGIRLPTGVASDYCVISPNVPSHRMEDLSKLWQTLLQRFSLSSRLRRLLDR